MRFWFGKKLSTFCSPAEIGGPYRFQFNNLRPVKKRFFFHQFIFYVLAIRVSGDRSIHITKTTYNISTVYYLLSRPVLLSCEMGFTNNLWLCGASITLWYYTKVILLLLRKSYIAIGVVWIYFIAILDDSFRRSESKDKLIIYFQVILSSGQINKLLCDSSAAAGAANEVLDFQMRRYNDGYIIGILYCQIIINTDWLRNHSCRKSTY